MLNQICTQCSPILSDIGLLKLVCYSAGSQLSQQEPALFLEVLRLFNAVETLWIDGYIIKTVVSEALESVALDWERAAEVLPVLDIIMVRGKWPTPQIMSMSTFIDARLEMGLPVELKWVNI